MILLNIFQRLGTQTEAIPAGTSTGTVTEVREGTESGESSWRTGGGLGFFQERVGRVDLRLLPSEAQLLQFPCCKQGAVSVN